MRFFPQMILAQTHMNERILDASAKTRRNAAQPAL